MFYWQLHFISTLCQGSEPNFGKSHELHSRKVFLPIQQALEKLRVEASMLFVGNQRFLNHLDVLLLLL